MTEAQNKDPLDSFKEPDFERLLCGVDEALIIKLFRYFSRFEHAMKMLGYKKQDNRGYLIGADWVDFASKFKVPYPTGSVKVDSAIELLCKAPVKRQKFDLTWEQSNAMQPTFEDALKQVPFIRNNLFHGGKYLRPNKERDETLIQSAIYLIQVCLDYNPDLLREFNNTGM